MNVEHLFFDGCPNSADADALVRDVVLALAPEATVEPLRVESEEEARRLRFFGSPSVRVDGEDLEGRGGGPFAFACRVYDHGDGLARGVPPRWLVEAAVLRALRPRGVLFLCVANSARSQLAEAIARTLAPPDVRVFSAGSEPTRVNPLALRVLAEVGIDAGGQRSKGLADVPREAVDTVVTLCAEEVCPAWLGHAHRVHWGLPDPAAAEGDDERRLAAFRAVRDELRRRLGHLFRGARRPAEGERA